MNTILHSTARVAARSRHVTIQPESIEKVSAVLSIAEATHWSATCPVTFDDCSLEERLQLALVFNSISFNYYSTPWWSVDYRGKMMDRGTWSMLAALRRAIDENIPVLDADYLARLETPELQYLLRGRGELLMLEERRSHLREIGRVLHAQYDGSAASLIAKSDYDARTLLELVTTSFPSFEDTAVYDGQRVVFQKRAQLFIADADHLLKEKNTLLTAADELTACADYILPRALYALGILRYSPELEKKIEQRVFLEKGGVEEVEIRANTIQAVELLKRTFSQKRDVTAMRLNDVLWANEYGNEKPYHLVRTTAY